MTPFSDRIKTRASAWLQRRKWRDFAFWAVVITVVLFVLKAIPGTRKHIGFSPWVWLAIWILASLPRLFRWMRWSLLWRLRNRLVVTYLLIGVTPVVLFGILAAISGYVLFGQFANFAAASEIQSELTQLAVENQALALHLLPELSQSPGALRSRPAMLTPAPGEAGIIQSMPNLKVGVYLNGKLEPLDVAPAHTLIETDVPPAWVHGRFRGLVVNRDHVYFRVITQETVAPGTLSVVTSLPLDASFLSHIANGLGRMMVWPNNHLKSQLATAAKRRESRLQRSKAAAGRGAAANDDIVVEPGAGNGSALQAVSGGTLPEGANVFDIPINIPTTLHTTAWSTGDPDMVLAQVTSRPSLLYQRLFRESQLIGGSIRIVLIAAGALFLVLELLAIFLAARLSRTITRSVSDLYHATREVDQGRLTYRIPVSRQDQLAALSVSFNTMSASLMRLLAEQQEKERMQAELAIAQEVQVNLFPARDVRLGGLELHGYCRPARTVSGDYYDFLLLGENALCMALGDISGKGISAALLMAGLHSAVRAYSFAGEEIFDGRPLESLRDGHGQAISAEFFQSPGSLMCLLNRHLYRSSQPEKYATLFLAHYDRASCVLRYANGGQLPPLVLRPDGAVLRLDRGGTVVGLLDNMDYEEGAVTLEPGDLLIGYSDGVTEPENEFGDFGEDRLVELVRENRHLPLEEISSRVVNAIEDWIGAQEQPDDITLVLARQH